MKIPLNALAIAAFGILPCTVSAQDDQPFSRAALPNGFASVETHCPEEQVELLQRDEVSGLRCDIEGKNVTLLDIPESMWLRMNIVGGFEEMLRQSHEDPKTDVLTEEPVAGLPAFRGQSVGDLLTTGLVIVESGQDRLLMLMVRADESEAAKAWYARSFGPIADSLVISEPAP